MRYQVVAADKAGTDWTVFQSNDPVLACHTAADHREQPFGYWYGVWDSDRDCWVDETEHEHSCYPPNYPDCCLPGEGPDDTSFKGK